MLRTKSKLLPKDEDLQETAPSSFNNSRLLPREEGEEQGEPSRTFNTPYEYLSGPKNQDFAEDVESPIKAAFISGGDGLFNIFRGLGLADDLEEPEKKALADLENKFPKATFLGKVGGESAPAIPFGGIAGAGLKTIKAGKVLIPAAQTFLKRMLVSGGIAATEGALIDRGTGGKGIQGGAIGGAFGVGAEILFSMMGRVGVNLFRRVFRRGPKGDMLTPMGKPTKELQSALDQVEMPFDEFKATTEDLIKKQAEGMSVEQSVAEALIKREGTPPPISKREAGEKIKGALGGRKTGLTKSKNAIYKDSFDDVSELGNVHILTDDIEKAIPDMSTYSDRVGDNQIPALKKLLVKYGIDKDPKKIAKFTKEMVDGEPRAVTPLSIKNFELFSKELNALSRIDTTGAASSAIIPIKEAFEKELDLITEAVGTENLPKEILESFKKARSIVKELHTVYSPQSIVGKIVKKKPDSFTEAIAASEVTDNLLSKGTSIEDLELTLSQLAKTSDGGKRSIQAIQSNTMMKLLDAGFSNTDVAFGTKSYNKALRGIGEEKIKAIFKNSPATAKRIMEIGNRTNQILREQGQEQANKFAKKFVEDVVFPSILMSHPKSAMLYKVMRGSLNTAIASGKALKSGVETRPRGKVIDVYGGEKFKKHGLKSLMNAFPNFASAIGIAAAVGEE